MDPFVYSAGPARVLFETGGLAKTGAELEFLGVHRALVLSTPQQSGEAEALAKSLGSRAVGVFSDAAMHTPVEVTQQAMAQVQSKNVDGIVSYGGGSTIGLGKAIALRTDLPQLAIPTTYAGSEMTPIIGQTEVGRKTTQTTSKVLPETVIYDPALTYTLPSFIAGPSAVNALAHAVEALYAENRNPVTSMQAEASIAAIGRSMSGLMSGAIDENARADAFYGAWLAGTCLASVGMGIHHKICHTLGGSFNLNHADIHCLMIPYTAAFNRDHAPEAMAAIARALGVSDPIAGLFGLMQTAAKTKDLKSFGMSLDDIERASDLAMERAYYNPRPITRDSVRNMLLAAYEGAHP
ncbi:maleylacetate reductase [Octadecabacter antarcticus 307]|uniref:Maleylacetate reductase n=1 Tax=Octadecabacter antarcticus 307 TaxID=391626 RepID=M9RFQ3_9RHOB|nr:maleylacetate reductase [Octadecabacter antarcticus]AGI68655.1 maleylacetate reductase [Octadecabacter antarcticus 307]